MPDDLITLEWLHSLSRRGLGRFTLNPSSSVELRVEQNLADDFGVRIIDTSIANSIRLPIELTTRGQVLALLTALGVEVKEKEQ